jgi:hypothetical protein
LSARVRSHVWISAFLRAEAAAGGYPAVIRKGAAEAGAIFVVHEHPDRSVSVYAPAPQSQFDDGDKAGRRFERVLERITPEHSQEWLDRQVKFDSDCWIVGTERADGEPSLVSG